jgi:hypothetical protein
MTLREGEAAAPWEGLLPGERQAANGVVIGSGAEPGIPRFGADQNDMDEEA